jgi:hypothetical protein
MRLRQPFGEYVAVVIALLAGGLGGRGALEYLRRHGAVLPVAAGLGSVGTLQLVQQTQRDAYFGIRDYLKTVLDRTRVLGCGGYHDYSE